MNWRIFCYNYRSGNQAFPVVTYAVTEPHAPSPLPEDFEQDVAATTDDSVTLTWTYDKIVSGFQLYRYYNFPDGSGRKELGIWCRSPMVSVTMTAPTPSATRIRTCLPIPSMNIRFRPATTTRLSSSATAFTANR